MGALLGELTMEMNTQLMLIIAGVAVAVFSAFALVWRLLSTKAKNAVSTQEVSDIRVTAETEKVRPYSIVTERKLSRKDRESAIRQKYGMCESATSVHIKAPPSPVIMPPKRSRTFDNIKTTVTKVFTHKNEQSIMPDSAESYHRLA